MAVTPLGKGGIELRILKRGFILGFLADPPRHHEGPDAGKPPPPEQRVHERRRPDEMEGEERTPEGHPMTSVLTSSFLSGHHRTHTWPLSPVWTRRARVPWDFLGDRSLFCSDEHFLVGSLVASGRG